MKRLVLLLGLPALLGVVWWGANARTPSATAEVTIDTSKVVEVRGLVISRLATVGATKSAEDTAYTGGGNSDLTFRLPPNRLEEALVELNLVGGVVTHQQVDLDDLTKDANDITSGLEDVGGCLTGVADRLNARGGTGVAAEVANCKKQLDATSQQLTSRPEAAQTAVLSVHITRTSTTSPWLFAAVGLLAIALAVMAYLTLRSARGDRVYDITEDRTPRPTEDLYHRRN